MIFHRLGLISKNQMGFTLLELLIALAITSVITGSTTMVIFQVFDGNARTSNHMEAVRQVQNAGYWVSRDAQMAQSIDIGNDPVTPELELVTLTWTEWNNTAHQITYKLQGAELWRDDGQPMRVAEYIDSDPNNTNCGVAAGSAFNLPDSSDAFTIIDAVGGDSGTITVAAGSITVTGSGTYNAGTGAWTTPSAGDTIVVAAAPANTRGNWTSATGTATATITVDSDGDATLAGGVLVLTVTAKVGFGSQQASETRVYKVTPKPSI